MKLSQRLLVLIAISLLARVNPKSCADVLAITQQDFSTTAQGTAGFEYGYYEGGNSTTAGFRSDLDPNSHPNGPYWGKAGLPSHDYRASHPGPSPFYPAVRRYTVGGSEPSVSGPVRIVGRFFDLNFDGSSGNTEVFIAVDGDGENGPGVRTLALGPSPVRGQQKISVPFDFTANVLNGTNIDFGVLAGSDDYYSDSTGIVAWIVTGDTSVPTNIVANNYSSTDYGFDNASQDTRGLAFAMTTDGRRGAADLDCFDTRPSALGYPQFAGLIYLQQPSAAKVTRFDSVQIDMGTQFAEGGDFSTIPRLYLLKHNSDPEQSNPIADDRYRYVPISPTLGTNAAGRPVYTFDLGALAPLDRSGYGFAVVGEGSGSGKFISVAELSAVATDVADAGFVQAEPRLFSYGGNRYIVSSTRGTWSACEAEGVQRGGHLVAINSGAEQTFITNTFGANETYYIGLRQTPGDPGYSEPAGGFKWTTGQPLTFKNWAAGEPNNYLGAGEDFVQFGPNTMQWGDVPAQGYPTTSSYRGILELPGAGSPTGPRASQLIVSGQANIFGAGQVNPTPCVNAGSGGVAAPFVPAFEGEIVTIDSAVGSIWSGAETSAADGTHNPPRLCDITGVAGVSGYLNRNNSAHLVGVFVGAKPLNQTPTRLDFSADATGENFTELSPGLGQVFFIGDGVTNGGLVQRFIAPAGATRLYLGIPDAYQGDTTLIYTGPPNAYADNSGSFTVRFTVAPGPVPVFHDTSFPASGTAFNITGGEPPYAPVEVTAGSLPQGLTISDKTILGRPAEEGTFPVTLRTVDAANHEATKQFTLTVAPVVRDLFAWWKADDDAQDSAGAHHGTYVGNATISGGGMVGGRAFRFDGEGDYVSVPDADELSLDEDFTIEAWVSLYSNAGREPTIISKRTDDGREVSYVLFVEADGRLTFASRALDSQGRDWLKTSTPAGVTLADDAVWTHLAVTCTGSTIRFYRNGTLVHTGTHAPRPLTNAPVTIGAGVVGTAVYGDWDGYIDELSLYGRALSAAEISAIVAADTMGKVFRTRPALTDETFPMKGGQLTIEGGTGPYTVTFSPETLPAGLSISGTGLVSGTAANGSYNFTLRVTDSAGKFTEQTFTGVIENPIAVPPGLVAWWPGDDTVADIIGGNHVGAASPAYTTGKIGRAFSFDGTSQSLQSQQPTDVLNLPSLTMEAWVKPEVRSDGIASDLFPANILCNDKRNFGGVGLGANVFASGSSLWIELQTENPANAHHQVTGAVLTPGEWHHVALVLTPGNAKTYLNGVLLESYDYAQGELDGDTTVRIGRHNDDTGFGSRRFFKGAIDEAGVYSRALPDSEIADLYAAGAGGKARYDASRDFNSTPNPTPPLQTAGALWTYGSVDPGPIDTETFVLSSAFRHAASTPESSLEVWSGGAEVIRNFTNQTFSQTGAGGTEIRWAPGQISMHPSGSLQYGVIRWTAPEAGRYAVSATFTGIDAHGVDTDVHVYHNTTALYNDAVASEFLGNGHSFTGVREVEEGETIDFIVGANGSASYDSTGTMASVVYLGPKLTAPTNLTIQTVAPPTSDRSWLFSAEDADEIDGITLRLQYADADTPDTWADLSDAAMTAPAEGEDTWTQVVNPLGLPAGNYYFRAVASVPGYGDKPSAAFGLEAIDSASTGPITVLVPGEPPPAPPKLPMPAVTALTAKIGGKANVTNARQGAIFSFTATQSLGGVRTLPADTEVRIQYSFTPGVENSWANLDEGKLDLIKSTATTQTWGLTTTTMPTTDGRPDGEQAIFFRTLTSAPNRLATAGPVLKQTTTATPVGPFTIASGPYWRYVSSNHESPSDNSGFTTFAGDTITYHIRFRNDPDSGGPATNVKVVMTAPKGTQVLPRPATNATRDDTSAGYAKITSTTVMWTIPSVARDQLVELQMKVRVKAKPYSTVSMPLKNMTVTCDQIKTVLADPEQLRGGPTQLAEWDPTITYAQDDRVRGADGRAYASLQDSNTGHVPGDGRAWWGRIDEGELLSTYVSSGLSIRISSKPSIARLGGTVDYEINADNKSTEALSEPVVSFRIPEGMSLAYVRLDNGSGDFTSSQLFNPTPATNPAVSEYRLDEKQLITWKLPTMPGNSRRTMRFTLRVQYDLPTFYVDAQGVSHTTNLTANEYNFVGKSANGKSLKAYKSAAGVPAVGTLISAETPLIGGPVLRLTKSSSADGSATSSTAPDAEFLNTLQVAGVGEASTVLVGKRLTYKLAYSNSVGAGPARNATIHDEIPDNAVFTGFIRRNEPFTDSNHNLRRDENEPYVDVNGNNKYDSYLVDTYLGFTFRNKDGDEVPGGGELFSDTNGNGRLDRGEYSDENGNGRYDGITDIKFIDFNVGLLNDANDHELDGGVSGSISYDVFPTGTPGKEDATIISRSGGAILPKVKKGQQFEGFSITSENIHIPVPGNPFKLASLVVPPATLDLQTPVVADTNELRAGGSVVVEIPYRVNGGQGLQFDNVTFTAYLPKNFQFDVSQCGFVDTSVPLSTSLRPFTPLGGSPVTDPKTGEQSLSFNVGNFNYGREGVLRTKVTLPNPLPADMLTAEGYLKYAGFLRVAKTAGSYRAPAAPAESGTRIPPLIAPEFLAPAGALTRLPVIGPKNTNLFVGRVSPLSIEPGQAFNVIVIFGNASKELAQGGTVTMKIPPGTTLTNVGPVTYHYSGSGEESRLERNEFWRTQKLPNGQTSIEIETLDLFPHDMAAVVLTLVENGVQGDRIEDDTLTVQTPNVLGRAAPRMSIVIRRQNLFSFIGNFFGSILGGIFDVFNGSAGDALKGYESTLGDGSRMIGISGADLVHLTNGSVVVPLGGARTMAVGPANVVIAPDFNTLADDGVTRMAVGRDFTPGFEIHAVAGSVPVAPVWKPADIINSLRYPASDLVAAGAGNLVAAGGLNLVAAGGLNLIDNSSGALGAAISPHNANLVAAGGLNLVAAGGGNLVAAGGLNLVAAGGGNLVAAGGGNLVAAGGLNLVAAGAGNLVAAGGGNLVAAGAGNLVAAGGLNLLSSDTPKLIGMDHASLQAVGGNLTNIQATSLIRLNGAEILSHNGGQILSHNGGQ